jgi:hypothetical protein
MLSVAGLPAARRTCLTLTPRWRLAGQALYKLGLTNDHVTRDQIKRILADDDYDMNHNEYVSFWEGLAKPSAATHFVIELTAKLIDFSKHFTKVRARADRVCNAAHPPPPPPRATAVPRASAEQERRRCGAHCLLPGEHDTLHRAVLQDRSERPYTAQGAAQLGGAEHRVPEGADAAERDHAELHPARHGRREVRAHAVSATPRRPRHAGAGPSARRPRRLAQPLARPVRVAAPVAAFVCTCAYAPA